MRYDGQRNLIASFAYIPFAAPVISIVILVVEKEDRYIRFHAMQSLLISLIYYAASIFLEMIFKGFIGFLVNPLLTILALVVWIISMLMAFGGRVFKWPLVGGFAEKQVR